MHKNIGAEQDIYTHNTHGMNIHVLHSNGFKRSNGKLVQAVSGTRVIERESESESESESEEEKEKEGERESALGELVKNISDRILTSVRAHTHTHTRTQTHTFTSH